MEDVNIRLFYLFAGETNFIREELWIKEWIDEIKVRFTEDNEWFGWKSDAT